MKKPSENNFNSFQWTIWIILVLGNFIFDFGRPIIMLIFPLELLPLNRPTIGDYFHIIYNILTPICLYKVNLNVQFKNTKLIVCLIFKLMKNTPKKTNTDLINIGLILLVMGASIHLGKYLIYINIRIQNNLGFKIKVAISINHRLLLEDNLQPGSLIKSFELLHFYNKVLGNFMWLIPYFICLRALFANSFKDQKEKAFNFFQSFILTILIILNAFYFWYLVTECQIAPLFLFSLIYMHVVYIYNKIVLKKHLGI